MMQGRKKAEKYLLHPGIRGILSHELNAWPG